MFLINGWYPRPCNSLTGEELANYMIFSLDSKDDDKDKLLVMYPDGVSIQTDSAGGSWYKYWKLATKDG